MTGHISGATVASIIGLLDEIKAMYGTDQRITVDQWRRLLDARVELAVALPAVKVERPTQPTGDHA